LSRDRDRSSTKTDARGSAGLVAELIFERTEQHLGVEQAAPAA
jgi:hypothetical protein